MLGVISSSPGELQPVFDAMLANAVRLCAASFGNLYLRDGEFFRMVAFHNTPPAFVAQRRGRPYRPSPIGPPGRMLRTRAVVHVDDLTADPSYRERDPGVVAFVELAGTRTVLLVPMLKDGEPIGYLSIYRQEVRPFADSRSSCSPNFAAQAVIAIENTRLLNELREISLQQQTATADVLKVISRSTFDLQAVLDTLVESAARLCEADVADHRLGRRRRLLPSCRDLRLLAPSMHDAHERIPIAAGSRHRSPGESCSKAGPFIFRMCWPIRNYNVRRSAAKSARIAPCSACRCCGKALPIGVIVLSHAQTVRPFTDKQIELVTTFADQAVIAIENVRLFDEVQARTRELTEALEQQTATSEVLQVISNSVGDLQPIFDAMLANATRLCGAEFGILNLDDGDVLRIAALYNVPPALGAIQNVPFQVHPKSGQAEIRRTKQVVHIDDIRAMPPYLEGDPRLVALADLGGARTTLAVPMLKESALLGSITIYRQEVRPFNDKQIELVTNFARSGRHRHREHAPAQRAARIAAAADRHRRRAQGDLELARRPGGGFPDPARECHANLRGQIRGADALRWRGV